MSYRNILVHVDSGPHVEARVRYALQLADSYNAHLTGVFVATSAYLAPLGPDAAAAEVYYSINQDLEKDAAAARIRFEQWTQAYRERSSWQQHIGLPAAGLSLSARYHDLLVLGQTEPGVPVDGLPVDLVQSVVLGSGRPALVLPYAGEAHLARQHALVAWNGSREATRALTDALPLLRRSAKVTVLTISPDIGPDGHGEQPGADIALYLARHDVKVTVAQDVGIGRDIGASLLSWSADHGVDLIVMGLYGHSRLREFIMGGASRTMLNTMTVPVFMSH
ncbi:universal stress protein [Chitinimonas sp.]|uniref:universal stress protein n=1 Tax=Chitinimonas sp. TaxID=1934313 RepID=UPI002F92F57C